MQKSDTLQATKRFLVDIDQYRRVKGTRSDNGSEFTSEYLLISYQIKLEKTSFLFTAPKQYGQHVMNDPLWDGEVLTSKIKFTKKAFQIHVLMNTLKKKQYMECSMLLKLNISKMRELVRLYIHTCKRKQNPTPKLKRAYFLAVELNKYIFSNSSIT